MTVSGRPYMSANADCSWPARTALASLLTSCPTTGHGVHNWIWRATLALRDILSPDRIKALLTVATKDCGRDCDRDIEDAVDKATGTSEETSSWASQPKLQPQKKKTESVLRRIQIN